jgi:pseudouridine-5'-phosphate glycosidase
MTAIVSVEVAAALAAGRPVVALESTIISHGMSYPRNIETARALERIVRENGATVRPSTTGQGHCIDFLLSV